MQAQYANFFKVGWNSVEFVVDFGQFYADSQKPLLHTRIITSPEYISLLRDLLSDAIDKYEGMFGPIRAANS